MNNSNSPIRFTVKGCECFVDEVDADLLRHSWQPHKSKTTDAIYLRTSIYKPQKRSPMMHREIMERILGRPLERGELVDHWDKNGLNNTRSNLRLATQTQNQANAKVRKDNRTGVKGVHIEGKKYRSAIRVNGKQINLGSFPTIELAHAAYMEAARQHFGEFASDGKLPTPPARTENGAQR